MRIIYILLFFICLYALLHLSAVSGSNDSDFTDKNINEIIITDELSPDTRDSYSGLLLVEPGKESVRKLKFSSSTKNSPIKRIKKPLLSEISCESYSYNYYKKAASEISGSAFANLSYLKFLRVTKMLC